MAPKVVELGAAHLAFDQSDADVKHIAAHLPWYGPAYSPHDVPNFYDISGITEDPKAFKVSTRPKHTL